MRNFDIALGRDRDYDIFLWRRAYEAELLICTIPFRVDASGQSGLILAALARCGLLRKFLSSRSAVELGGAALGSHMTDYGSGVSQLALGGEGEALVHSLSSARESVVQLESGVSGTLDKPFTAGESAVCLPGSSGELLAKKGLGTPEDSPLMLEAGIPVTEKAADLRTAHDTALDASGSTAKHTAAAAGGSLSLMPQCPRLVERQFGSGDGAVGFGGAGAELTRKRPLGTPLPAGIELSAGEPGTRYAASMEARTDAELGSAVEETHIGTRSGTGGSVLSLGVSGNVGTEMLRLRLLYELDDLPLDDMDGRTLRDLDYVKIEDL